MLDVFTAEQLPGRICEAIKGGATRLLCPKCGGGQSKEISLSVRPLPGMDGSVPLVQLKCFRNSCGWHANVMFGEGAYFKLVRQQVHEAKIYDKETMSADKALTTRRIMHERYGLEHEHYSNRGWLQHLGNGPNAELVMTVLGPSGELRGHLARTFTKPKRCQAYKQSAQPWLDWWIRIGSSKLFIVEDQISACKIHASGAASAVSLVGTNMPVDKAREIAQVCKLNGLRPMLALDPDAQGTAFAYQKRYAHIMPDMGVFVLKQDPKDTAMDGLKRMIGDV